MTRVTVVNGPNLNLLGQREPGLYGSATLADIEAQVRRRAGELAVSIEWMQSNHEGELVEVVQGLARQADGAIVNLGGYTHTSVAIRDAFLAAPIPFVEVHVTNPMTREPMRHHSMTADLAIGLVAGFGAKGYVIALEALVASLRGN
ncbi:MAG: type II 3-dehydroquinate dehydratase [Gemmatimonadota bacterium]